MSRAPTAPDSLFVSPRLGYSVYLALNGKPSITIYVPGPLRSYCGNEVQLPIAARTVQEALQVLERDQSDLYRNICDETGTLRRHLNVFVNADHMRDLAGVHTVLKTGDVVTFLPAVSGG